MYRVVVIFKIIDVVVDLIVLLNMDMNNKYMLIVIINNVMV